MTIVQSVGVKCYRYCLSRTSLHNMDSMDSISYSYTDFDGVRAIANVGYCVTQIFSTKYTVILSQYIPSSKENILGLNERQLCDTTNNKYKLLLSVP